MGFTKFVKKIFGLNFSTETNEAREVTFGGEMEALLVVLHEHA